MKNRKSTLVFGALLALSVMAVASADAACTFATVTSVKGTLSGTFWATDGTPTKVKCDLTLERNAGGSASFSWGSCPGIGTYGTGVFMNSGQAQRILKATVAQKSCVISNQYTFDLQAMRFVSVGVVATADTADPTVLSKEKGTLNFTRNDGVFAGKYTVVFPKP